MTEKKVSSRPIIGVLPDFKEGSANGYSIRNYYAIRANYIESLIKAGATPLILTYDYNAIDSYLDLIDGLMVVGGFMDISPSRYNENFIHPTTKLNLVRENFEAEIVSRALNKKFVPSKLNSDNGEKISKNLNKNLPILGICNGMQLIAVLRGAKLNQHLPENPALLDHEQSHFAEFNDSSKPYHQVSVVSGSKYSVIADKETLMVNSSHHQAISTLENSGLKVCALAPDGVIEAIEDPNHDFCIGVQWHPEFAVSSADEKLFAAFVNQAAIFNQIRIY